MNEWLQSTSHFSWQEETNQQILESSYKPEGWFNPFLEPEKIDTLRQESGMTGAKWQEFVETYYPDLDPQEQYSLRIQENKQRKIGRCGEKSIELNSKGIPFVSTFHCGECDNCLKDEAHSIKEAVQSLRCPLRLLVVPESERAKVKRRIRDANLKCQTYLVNEPDGLKCHFLVATDNEKFGEQFHQFNFDYSQWAGTIEGKRQSGNLLPSNRTLVRGENEEPDTVIDSGQVMHRRITAKFDKLPEDCKTLEQVYEIAGQYAVGKTMDFAPQYVSEIQECIRKREDLIITKLRNLGGVIYGIEVFRSPMRNVTENTPQEWLEAARNYAKKDKIHQIC